MEPREWAPHLAQIIITMSAGSEFCTNKYHSVWSLMFFGHYSSYDKCKLPSHQMKMFPESQKTTLDGNIYVNADKSLTRTNIESPTLCRAVNVVGTNLNLVTCGFIVLFMKTFINVLSRAPFAIVPPHPPHPVCVISPVTLRASHWSSLLSAVL